MKTRKLIPSLIIGLCLGTTVFSGCKKDKDETPAQTNTQKLCDKNWKMTGLSMSPGYMGFTDVYSFMDACETDDKFMFKTNGTAIDNEGATKCDPADPQTENGTWAWANNETKIVLNIGGIPSDPMNVMVNDGVTLKVNYTATDSTLGTQKYTMTFAKQ